MLFIGMLMALTVRWITHRREPFQTRIAEAFLMKLDSVRNRPGKKPIISACYDNLISCRCINNAR